MAKKDKVKEKNKKHYFKDMKAELKKVNWLSPKQLANNTIAVLTIVILTAVIVFALDVVFDLFNKYAIAGIQSKVQTTYQNTVDTNSVSEDSANITEYTNTISE